MQDKDQPEVEHEAKEDIAADFTCVVDELFEFVDDCSAKPSQNPQPPPLIPLIVQRIESPELMT